jgi:hypothetical protein
MKFHSIAAASLALAAGLLTAPQADAALASRYAVQMAPGMCQPFATTGKVRYSASGISNVGTTQFYVVCSMEGTWHNSENGGATLVTIIVTNNSSTPQTIPCTARPGYVFGSTNEQLAKPKSATIAPGGFNGFTWRPEDFSVAGIMNVNFTCALKPGTTINLIERDYQEEIGT